MRDKEAVKSIYKVKVDLPKTECNIDNRIMSVFDNTYDKTLYETGDDHGNPVVYRTLCRDMMQSSDVNGRTVLMLSGDSGNTSAVITGLSKRYMYTEALGDRSVFKSNLKVLYIDSYPDLDKPLNREFDAINASVLSNSMSMFAPTYTNHELNMNPDQFTVFGINSDAKSRYRDKLLHLGIIHYGLDDIRLKGVDTILESVVDMYNEDMSPVVVSVDLSVLESTSCPSVYRRDYKNKEGLTKEEYFKVLSSVKKIDNIVGICITGFDYSLITDDKIKMQCDMLTTSIIRETVTTLTDLKEKSINIFNEESYFLIWRPIYDTDEDGDEDYGWYILRDCPLDMREKLMTEDLKDDDVIITDTVIKDGEEVDAMITKTTMKEQQDRSYYSGGSYADCILFPHEKVAMMFEMLKTPQASVNGADEE